MIPLIIIALCLLAFGRTLRYHYVSDDLPVSMRYINEDKGVKPPLWKQLVLTFRGKRYYNHVHAHIITLAVHILNSILVYYAFGSNTLSFMTACIWAIHPINTQGGAIWLSGKHYSTGALFVLLMFTIPQLSPLFAWWSFYAVVNGMFMPLMFFFTPYWGLAIPLTFIHIYRSRSKVANRYKTDTNENMREISPRKIIPAIKSFGYYFWLCLVPHRLGLYHEIVWGLGVTKHYNARAFGLNWTFAWTLMTCFLWLGLVIAFWGTPLAFGLLWFFIAIAMWCNVITIMQQVSERYCYIANIGLMFALCYAFTLAPYPYNAILYSIFFTAYFVRLWFYIPFYENEYWQVEHTAMQKKYSHYAWIARGVHQHTRGNFVGALMSFLDAYALEPKEFKCCFNVGMEYLIVGKPDLATKFLNEAKENVYIGVEKNQLAKVQEAFDLLEEVKTTKRLDLRKVQVIK